MLNKSDACIFDSFNTHLYLLPLLLCSIRLVRIEEIQLHAIQLFRFYSHRYKRSIHTNTLYVFMYYDCMYRKFLRLPIAGVFVFVPFDVADKWRWWFWFVLMEHKYIATLLNIKYSIAVFVSISEQAVCVCECVRCLLATFHITFAVFTIRQCLQKKKHTAQENPSKIGVVCILCSIQCEALQYISW